MTFYFILDGKRLVGIGRLLSLSLLHLGSFSFLVCKAAGWQGIRADGRGRARKVTGFKAGPARHPNSTTSLETAKKQNPKLDTVTEFPIERASHESEYFLHLLHHSESQP